MLLLNPSLSGCYSQTRLPLQEGVTASIEHDVYFPERALGPLFHDVQMAQVFADGKTFVDMRPIRQPADILVDYHAQRVNPAFQLAEFVQQNFAAPEALPSPVTQNVPSMLAHIDALWPLLTRPADGARVSYSTLIPLPNAYVVPGGRFREIYYWDSYFTLQGLVLSEQKNLARSMVQNFAWLIDHVGHIPNGNRTYYLSRSQPPFFAGMVGLLREQGLSAPGEFLPQLQREYEFWMRGADAVQIGEARLRVVKMPDGSLLNRYFDHLAEPRPESYREDWHTAEQLAAGQRQQVFRDIRAAAESGWDFSSRWLADAKNLSSIRTTAIVPVDLNSLLYHLEREISRQYAAQGAAEQAQRFAQKAEQRAAAIQRWLWNSQRQIFGDYLFAEQRFTDVDSLATVYPLYFGLATAAQAQSIAEHLQKDFLKAGGLVTTLEHTGQQWDAPNGWAPLQWLAVRGLSHYGFTELAEAVALRWLALNHKIYRNTGRMMEKYNVEDTTLTAGGGEYPTQDGFGWTNGVAAALEWMYGNVR